MTLRARLILALLALALIPTAFFTLFTLDQLNRAIASWYYQPGIDRALQGALEVTKGSVAHLESWTLAQSEDWAKRWPAGNLDARERSVLRATLRASGLDFIQVYRMRNGRWTLVDQLVPEGVLVAQPTELGDDLAALVPPSRILHSTRGALAAAAPLKDGDLLVAGLWVPPDFFAQVERVAQGVRYYRPHSVTLRLHRWYVWLLVVAVALIITGVAVVLARALAGGMSRPLGDLSRAIERIAAGNLAARVTPAGAAEFRSLGRSFNAMAERLEANRDALQRAEREAAWRDVARKLAHEFKNMGTTMKLSLQLVERGIETVAAESRDSVLENLHAALEEVDHLGALSEQFSQYARLAEPRFETVDLAEVARGAARPATMDGVRLSASELRPAPVRGDRVLLARAVSNLVRNACEASAPGGQVELLVNVEQGSGVIEVLDRGSGLPPGLGERLFEPYVSTKNRGSGLGLSLVRDVALQHGGTVTLEEREGGGARARLVVPLAAPSPPATTEAGPT